MSVERIYVDPMAIEELRSNLEKAGEEYKSQLARLTNLMNEITKGDIQGPMADDLLKKFEEKRNDFNSLATAISDAEQNMGIKGTDFDKMVENFKENAR